MSFFLYSIALEKFFQLNPLVCGLAKANTKGTFLLLYVYSEIWLLELLRKMIAV